MANDKKISEFLSDSSIDDTTEFTFVANNTNFKTTFADLKTNLGTVGQLSSIGDALGTPILNQPTPTTNEIRKVIGAKGVIASTSAGDGVQVAGNFVNGSEAGAVGVIQSLTSDQTLFRSIEAGSGIAVTQADDSIRISTTATPVSTKVTLITKESDFPIQDATTITLEANNSYEIADSFSTAKTMVSNGARVFSELPIAGGPYITYTGTGSLFSITEASLELSDLAVTCANGSLYELTGDDTFNSEHRIVISNVIVGACDTIGQSTGEGSVFVDLMQITSVTGSYGFKFSGNSIIRSLSRIALVGLQSGSIGADFGTSVSTEVEVSNFLLVVPDAASIAISGAAGSANLIAGSLGTVTGCNFSGITAPLQNITPEDVRWQFSNNAGVQDSTTDCLISIDANTTETVITIAGTPVLMAGTFTDVDSNRFTVTASGGRMTYNGERSARLPIDYTVSMLLASGGSKQISAQVHINGLPVGVHIKETASSSQAANLVLIWQHNFQPNDYVELWLANETDTVNVIGQSAIGRVN